TQRSTRSLLAITLVVGLPLWTVPGMTLASSDWQELGPAPIINGGYTGRVSAVACSPTDRNRYFAGAADGGVWRTTDGGSSWTPLTDHMPTSAMGALALDPLNENTIYAGTGEANYANHSRYGLGLYKSTDGGESWVQLAEDVFGGRCFSKIVINPLNSQIIYAAITRAGGFPELAAAKGHPGATGPLGLFRSSDGGLSWAQLTNGLPSLSATDVAIDPSAPHTLYAAIGRIFGHPDNGIYKSTDGGDSWSKLGGGLPSETLGRISLAVAPSMPSRIYTLITRPSDAFGGGASVLGAYRSDDGGGSWTYIPVGDIQATYGWYLSVVSVQPTDPDVVIMGGLSLRRSTNAGANWYTITPPHVDMHAIAWDADGRMVVGDDGGVHRTSNLGNNWTSHNNNLGVIQFYAGLSLHPTSDVTIFGGTQDNGSNRRNTDTMNWTQVFGGDGGWTQVDQSSPNRVFVEYQGTGNLYRSTNGGDGFSYVGYGISGRNCFLPPFLIDPDDSQRMLYGTDRIYQSLSGGTGWSALSGDLTDGAGAIRALAMAPSNPNMVYAATNDGNVLVSIDGGEDFTQILDDVPGWPRVTREMFVHPHDPLTMYLAVAYFGEDQVRRTRDAGQSWEILDGDLPDIPVNVVAADVRYSTPVIYAGADDGVYRSADDGLSWHRYGIGLPRAAVIDMRLDTARARLIIGTQGRGAWSIGISIPGDLNDDGCVDQADLGILLAAFGIDGGGDLDGDGDTDQADLGILLAHWGEGCP
ncbi:MAG TPA: hypothetical protein VM487_21750, partial [Phycisphaerae bacterium]|nr:hypothetical protein [Phycisphaerae bacterium]